MKHRCHREHVVHPRRGGIVILAAGILVLVFSMAAFAIDLGYIVLTKAELQKSADAAALAGVLEMYDGFGLGALPTESEMEARARAAAVEVAAANRAGGQSTTYADSTRDVRLGQMWWDEDEGAWMKSWGTAPYNLCEVTLHRDQLGSTTGDAPLDLFFAPMMGKRFANVEVSSAAAMLPGVGLRIVNGRNVGILPITLDVDTWDDLLAGIGDDDFSFDPETNTISNGPDGILEVNLYPSGSTSLPPGNRGTVDFGHAGNSTADISRQILYGLDDDDLSYFGGEIDFDDLPMQINGDTGLSAGIKDELETIKGEPRLIPLFSEVSGPGNNAMYTIVRFVPIRVLYVRLTGKPSSKRVVIQPAPYVDLTVVPGETEIRSDSIFAPASLID